MSDSKMRIAIYDCVKGDALTEAHGPVSALITRWISPHLPEASFRDIHIAAGAELPDLAEIDGAIISGSEMGVYDDLPWIATLRAHLFELRDHRIPIFGICFGHQLMADAFGGRAEKVDKGYIAGAQAFEMGRTVAEAHVAHQDQVTQVPPGAEITASAPYCPAAALTYDFPALSVQFHPEHSEAFARDLIEMFGKDLMNAHRMAEATRSLKGAVAPDLYTEDVATFFRANARRN